jgi:hypothetical protein
VRHHLVQRIVRAYDEHKARVAEEQMLLLTEAKNAEAAGSEKPATAQAAEKSASAETKG